MEPHVKNIALLAPTASASGAGTRVVLTSSPLTRLNYFDGKFLRAADLRIEQDYVRKLVALSNQGGGWGVVAGLDTQLDHSGQLSLGAGLAVDGDGRLLLLPETRTFNIDAVIAASRAVTRAYALGTPARGPAPADVGFTDCIGADAPPPAVSGGNELWLICITPGELLCGSESVYGKLCEQACTTGTERPYAVEGITLRVQPLVLGTMPGSFGVPLTSKHLRSWVASRYFARESEVGSLISGAGLRQEAWCLGADLLARGCIPLGVLARAGEHAQFLDAWIARRERMEAPARRYWAWRMAMRPWNVFLAQVLQFQCQLHELLDDGTPPRIGDCAGARDVLDDVHAALNSYENSYARNIRALERLGDSSLTALRATPDAIFSLEGGVNAVASLRDRVKLAASLIAGRPGNRVLIDGGIIELPSAGYLPVQVGNESVESQVRRFMGPGVDLRFCAVRHDFVAHALEEAQHMDRISLLAGLDDPEAKPDVDILVPDGELVQAPAVPLPGFQAAVTPMGWFGNALAGRKGSVTLRGAARTERTSGGGDAFHIAVAHQGVRAATVESAMEAMRSSANAMRSVSNLSGTGTAETTVRELDPSLVSNMMERARRARSFAAEAAVAPAAAEPVAAPAAAPPAAVAEDATLAGTPDAVDVVAWLTARTEQDVFAMSATDRCGVDVEVALSGSRSGQAGQSPYAMRIRLSGQFTPAGNLQTSNGEDTRYGSLSCSYAVEAAGPGIREAQEERLELRVSFARRAADASGMWSVSWANVTEQSYFFRLLAEWSGSPRNVKLTVSLKPLAVGGSRGIVNIDTGEVVHAAPAAGPGAVIEIARPELTLATGLLVASEAAMREGSPERKLAAAGLQVLEDELSRANFVTAQYADVALARLFPAAPRPDGSAIRATTDWVLFHRRRVKRCYLEPKEPPKAAVRAYALFAVDADVGSRAAAVIAALAANVDAISKFNPRYIGPVTFRLGATAPETLAAALQAQWQQVLGTGQRVAFIGASDVHGEDDTVVAGRGRSTVAALSPVAMPDAQMPAAVLPRLPLGVDLHGGEELLLAVVYRGVVPVPHHAYAFVAVNAKSAAVAETVATAIAKPTFNDVQLITSSELRPGGAMEFEAAGDVPSFDGARISGAIGADRQVVQVAIASDTLPVDAVLAGRRLDAAAAAAAQFATNASAGHHVVLGHLPAGLDLQGARGAILCLTQPQPVVPKTEKVTVWAANVLTLAEAKGVDTQLAMPPGFSFTRIGEQEFGKGGDAPTTPVAGLVDEWRAAVPAGRVLGQVMVFGGTPANPLARAAVLADGFKGHTPLQPSAANRVIPHLPPGVSAQNDAAGVAIVVTYRPSTVRRVKLVFPATIKAGSETTFAANVKTVTLQCEEDGTQVAWDTLGGMSDLGAYGRSRDLVMSIVNPAGTGAAKARLDVLAAYLSANGQFSYLKGGNVRATLAEILRPSYAPLFGGAGGPYQDVIFIGPYTQHIIVT